MRSRRHIPRCLLAAATLPAAGPASAQVTFADEAPAAGISNVSFGRGSAMVDLDGDGLLDIVAGNDGMPNAFFRQSPDHTFVDAAEAWGVVPKSRATWGVLAADFDNDGDPDLYFINGGFVGLQKNRLLRNDLDTSGVLTDVSGVSEDADVFSQNFGGTTLDYDRDGLLDIFLTATNPGETCRLLRNDGDLSFTEVTEAAGLVQSGRYRHCTSGDFDNDGWIDVAVGNEAGPNLLYRNNGDGTFTDVAAAAGVDSPDHNFGLVLEDFDNDGWMDLYAPKFQVTPAGPSKLFRNNGDGTFADVTAGSGMTGQTDMGHNTGDLDGDGFPDIFIGTGHPDFASDDLLLLVTPDGAGGFAATDVSHDSGITANGPTRCHGIALGDYDRDGAVDVYTNNGGPALLPGTIEGAALWRSQGPAGPWTALRLTGVISNRTAVGARAVAVTDSGRKVHRFLAAGNGFASTDSPILHFGIDPDLEITRIDITWPSGIKQTITGPPMGGIIDVTEPDTPCPWDLDGDGTVGITDFLALLAQWGTSPGGPPDFDGDGAVGITDLLGLLSSWGACQDNARTGERDRARSWI